MKEIPFNENEMEIVDTFPGFHGGAPKILWAQPVSYAQNWRDALQNRRCHYIPSALDFKTINPRIVPDLRAKAMVNDADGKYSYPGVECDNFGVEWINQPEIGGPIEKGGFRLLDDISDWEEKLAWPDIDSWGWDEAAAQNKEYCSDRWFFYKTICVTGFFERLISFIGFEDALVAMIDEDTRPSVQKFFDKLSDFYCDYVEHMKRYFDIDLFEFHDDWGTQANAMFNTETYETMIFPYVKKVVSACHRLGVFYEQHSCGKVQAFIPYMIEAGIDLWMGQDCNDKLTLVKQYGDKITIGVEPPELPVSASDEEIHEAACEWAADYLIPEKPCALSIFAAKNVNRDRFEKELYVLSRKAYC